MDFAAVIARQLTIRKEQADATIELLDAGNTIPFIARYRKEATFGLDEEQIRQVAELIEKLRTLEERRAAILQSIEEQGKLTDELKVQIQAADTMTALEDGSAFVAQLDSTGQATWAKVLPSDSITDDVAVGPDGKVHFVGRFANDEVLYTYDPTSDTLTPRRTVAGNVTANEIRTSSVAVSTTGAVWFSGSFKETINLGTGALSTSTVAAFLLKID